MNSDKFNIKKRLGERINKHSKRVFILMGLLIIGSIIITVIKSITREKKEFKIETITNEASNDISNDFNQLGRSYNKYQRLKNLDDRLNFLLEKEDLSKSDSIELIRLYEQLKAIK